MTAKKKVRKKVAVKKESPSRAINRVEEKKERKRTYIFAVGRRKSAVARVRYHKKGEGEIIINDKDLSAYFPYFEFQKIILAPLDKLGLKDFGQFTIKVNGGGKRGQAESIRLGIGRCLDILDKSHRRVLKGEGFLRRDARVKERKKYGLKRARRAPQWQKR